MVSEKNSDRFQIIFGRFQVILGRFRTVVGGARVVSGAEKKAFDRGGPVWPPRSNVTNDRLKGASGGACAPSQKSGGLGGSAPQPKSKKHFFFFFRFFEKFSKKIGFG